MQNKVDRASLFMPFDALKGFREALKEKEKEVIEKKDFYKYENKIKVSK